MGSKGKRELAERGKARTRKDEQKKPAPGEGAGERNEG
jgi:hypothetical protein